jgi:hypothetical protein
MRHADDRFTLDLPGLDIGQAFGSDPLAWVRSLGYGNPRRLPGAGICATKSMLFTGAIVVGIDAEGYAGRFCYESDAEALDALMSWDGSGDPPGNWIAFKGQDGDRPGPGSVASEMRGTAPKSGARMPPWKRVECPACGSPAGAPCFKPRLGASAVKARCAPHRARREAAPETTGAAKP